MCPHVTIFVVREYTAAVSELERVTGKIFGSSSGPQSLLLSIRAGAPFHPPCLTNDEIAALGEPVSHEELGMRGAPESLSILGVHDTLLGLGMNDLVD